MNCASMDNMKTYPAELLSQSEAIRFEVRVKELITSGISAEKAQEQAWEECFAF